MLISYLRADNKISATAFADSGDLPKINKRCEEEMSKTDTIGRLRQVAVHRWDYNTHLLRDVIGFLAVLKDRARIAEIEVVLQRLPDSGVDAIPSPTCTTKAELLTTLVSILERTFHNFALTHCPDTLPSHASPHAHALELQHLPERVLASLPLRPAQIRETNDICRALRNAAAHHNSFTPEAIQGRKDGGNVACRYDAFPDPYVAIAADVENVALLLGDEVAAREVRLSLWSADVSVRTAERKSGLQDVGASDYLALARRAESARGRMDKGEMGWEPERTLFGRYGESVQFLEGRADAVVGGEARGIFEGWSKDVVGRITDPRVEEEAAPVWVA